MAWQPLLQGDLKDRAWERIQAILLHLSTLGEDPSLASGTAGLALLHGYLALTECGPDHAATSKQCLEHVTAAVPDRPTAASLYGGLAGVGWAIAHLQGRLPGLDGQDDLAEIDDALLEHLERSPWDEDYDRTNGLVGFGVYAVERLPRPTAVTCLERVIDHLVAAAEHKAPGVTWWTNPAWLPAETQAKFPHGYYNLALAHGVPGVPGSQP
jgi:hypothetical protein